MKKIFFAIGLAALITACSNPEVKRAEEFYQRAETAYSAGYLSESAAWLDSIESGCKSAIDWRKKGHVLSYSVQLAQQEDSLTTADTMLVVVTRMINEMIEAGKFQFEKGEYDELGRYYVKGTDVQSNLERSYIHATTNEYGQTQLISEYRGPSYINHTQVRFSNPEGAVVESREIPLSNDGANYHFENQGLKHETVTYTNDPALAFVDMNVSNPKLRAHLLYNGGKTYSVQLSEADRRAVSMTYQLGQMLAAQLLYTQQSKTAALKIQYLKGKMSQHQTPAE